jgi:hypothetical protein
MCFFYMVIWFVENLLNKLYLLIPPLKKDWSRKMLLVQKGSGFKFFLIYILFVSKQIPPISIHYDRHVIIANAKCKFSNVKKKTYDC